MENRLREYMDGLFIEVPPTKQAVELKEEILQNLVDKYHDMLEEGKSPEAAFNISVASVGDVEELLSELNPAGSQKNCPDAATLQKQRQKSAILTASAVMLYILCVLPVIITENALGVCLMFLMIAAATGLLIYNHMARTGSSLNDGTIVEDFKEWQEFTGGSRRMYRALSNALWSLAVVVYCIISFSTMAWNMTWIIFLIAAAIQSIIRAALELRK